MNKKMLFVAVFAGIAAPLFAQSSDVLRDAARNADLNLDGDLKSAVSDLKEQASAFVSMKGREKFSLIEFDRRVYSWRDKVYITIAAPQLNEDPRRIETVGAGADGGVLMIKTGAKEIGPYKLTETGLNTGFFTGVIRLQGFWHEAGEGRTPTPLPSGGIGPNDGKLATLGAEDALVASYRPRGDNSNTYMRSSLIRWNIGEIAFESPKYDIGSEPYITLTDPDRNLDPDALDTVLVHIWSDSDAAGTAVTLIEDNESTGKFSQSLTLTTTGTSHGKRLRVAPGDTITARYIDKTLPAPYGPSGELKISATTSIEKPAE